jgi:hypothetical protein
MRREMRGGKGPFSGRGERLLKFESEPRLKRRRNMRWPALLLFALLAPMPAGAKPKVDVHIRVHDGLGRDHATDSLSKSGGTNPLNVTNQSIFFLNVTVTSGDAAAVAKNHGEWCISGDNSLDINGDYDGTLDGNKLEIRITSNNGKMKKYHYEIYDHKWRKLADI